MTREAREMGGSVEVKKYKSEHEFEKDAEKMIKKGWHIEGQSSRTKKWSLATGFFTNKGVTTVTWVKGPIPEEAPTQRTPQPAALPDNGPASLLQQLGQLHQAGVLTDAEFEAKKAQVLERL
jgi:hypothetical protein